MNEAIEFTEEQGMLLETAADFCRNHSPIDGVRERLDATEIDSATWKEISELGWLGINVPAEYGGLELGLASVVPVIESMGRNLMASPYSGTIVAIEALVSSGSDAQKLAWLPNIVEGLIATMALSEPDGSWALDQIESQGVVADDKISLSGTKCFVTDADCTGLIVASVLVDGEVKLVLLEGSNIPVESIVREVVIDQTRRSFQLNLNGIEVPLSQLMPLCDLKAIELASMLMICAEISGGLVGVLHAIVEYLNTRKAFDRYIGSYQSLKHPAVDILLQLEGMRSHLYHAATEHANQNTKAAEIALRIAKAHGSEAFAFAGDRAVQFHGGFGFTFECDAQLYLRRALWCQYQFGDEKHQRQLLAPLLLDEVNQ
jgi:acyl-CoA dehydrogenase